MKRTNRWRAISTYFNKENKKQEQKFKNCKRKKSEKVFFFKKTKKKRENRWVYCDLW